MDATKAKEFGVIDKVIAYLPCVSVVENLILIILSNFWDKAVIMTDF